MDSFENGRLGEERAGGGSRKVTACHILIYSFSHTETRLCWHLWFCPNMNNKALIELQARPSSISEARYLMELLEQLSAVVAFLFCYSN